MQHQAQHNHDQSSEEEPRYKWGIKIIGLALMLVGGILIALIIPPHTEAPALLFYVGGSVISAVSLILIIILLGD